MYVRSKSISSYSWVYFWFIDVSPILTDIVKINYGSNSYSDDSDSEFYSDSESFICSLSEDSDNDDE